MSDSTTGNNDETAESALRAGLSAKGLSPEAMLRIRRAAEAEWRAQVGAQNTAAPKRPSWKWSAAAAAIFVVFGAAFGVIGLNDRVDSGASFGRVARAESPGIELKQLLHANVPVAEHADLRVPASLDARGDTLIALAGGGNLRVARGSSFDLPAADTVRLTRGELYLDFPPGARPAKSLVVQTPAGEFRHLGTQFSVAILNGDTRLRVREGSVLWQGNEGQDTVTAGTEVLISNREVSRRPISTTGRDWAWAETLAPEIDIEDRPLQEFLAWFSRETGRKLVLADDAARQQVVAIRMHGTVRGLTAMEALTAVMAATTLHYELPEGAIRVSSPRESRPTR